jgi:putative addiction module component (TIGR02574 family)
VTAETERILEQALALRAHDRAALIDALAESLDHDGADLDSAWTAEIDRRIDAIERGQSRLIPGDEVDERVRRIVGR